MKKMKKLFALMLALVMMVSLFAGLNVTAYAAGAKDFQAGVADPVDNTGYVWNGKKLFLYGADLGAVSLPANASIEVMGYSKVASLQVSGTTQITGSGVLDVAGGITAGSLSVSGGYVKVGAAVSASTLTLNAGHMEVAGNVTANNLQMAGGYMLVKGGATAAVSASKGFLEVAGTITGTVNNAGGVVKCAGITGDVTASSGVTIAEATAAPAIGGTATMSNGEKMFELGGSAYTEVTAQPYPAQLVIAKNAIYVKRGAATGAIQDGVLDSVYTNGYINDTNALSIVGGSYVANYVVIGESSSSGSDKITGNGTLVARDGIGSQAYASYQGFTGTLVGFATNATDSKISAGIMLVSGSYSSGEYIGVANKNANSKSYKALRFILGRGSYSSKEPTYTVSGTTNLIAISHINNLDAILVNAGANPAFSMSGGSITAYAADGSGIEFDKGALISGGSVSAVGLDSYGYGISVTGNTLEVTDGAVGLYGKHHAIENWVQSSNKDGKQLLIAADLDVEHSDLTIKDRKKFTEYTNNKNDKVAYFAPYIPEYDLTYDPNGGVEDAITVKVEVQEDYPLAANTFTHADDAEGNDVVFIGWMAADDNEKVYTKDDTAPATITTVDVVDAPVTVYAAWGVDTNGNGIADVLEDEYTVTYDNNAPEDAVVTGTVTDDTLYLEGDTVTVLSGAALECDGYVFAGWNTAADGTGTAYVAGNTITVATANVTLYAQWAETYSVIYDNNAPEDAVVTGTVTDENTYLDGDAVTVLGAGDLTCAGYLFAGWNTAADGSGTAYDEDDTFEIDAADVTLYAQWDVDANGDQIADKYQKVVIFQVVNGTWEDGTTEDIVEWVTLYDEDENLSENGAGIVTIPDGMIPAPSYDYGTWNPEPAPVVTRETPDVFVYTFYRENTPVVSLDYESNGGTEYETEYYTQGSTVRLSKVPSRPGYIFTGWYADPELTQPITKIWLNEDKIVYAGWTKSEVPDDLNGDTHFAYIIGYEDGTVKPTANITRAQVATIFFRLLDENVRDAALTTTNSFADVNEGQWYNTAISTLASMGIVNGRTADTFAPDATITRAEFAAICARFSDGVSLASSPFTDIAGHWAEDEINTAYALGWIQGRTADTFAPDAAITRAEAMTMINRVLQRLPKSVEDLHPDMRIWSDNLDTNQWFYLAVQEATNSHTYERAGDGETWTAIVEDPDWTRYE